MVSATNADNKAKDPVFEEPKKEKRRHAAAFIHSMSSLPLTVTGSTKTTLLCQFCAVPSHSHPHLVDCCRTNASLVFHLLLFYFSSFWIHHVHIRNCVATRAALCARRPRYGIIRCRLASTSERFCRCHGRTRRCLDFAAGL